MRARLALCALVLATFPPHAALAGRTPSAGATWTSPDFARFDVRSIAFMPVAMYEKNLENEHLVESAFGQALRNTGYRFVSTMATHDALVRAGGDSLLKAFQEQVLKGARVDSAQAAGYSRMVHARALLTVRVDRMERLKLDYDQSGKPSTTVELHAALVDSTGQMLWWASGAHTLEGQYQEAATGSLGMQAGGLQSQPATGNTGPPTYAEVLAGLLAKWAPTFPTRPAAAVAN